MDRTRRVRPWLWLAAGALLLALVAVAWQLREAMRFNAAVGAEQLDAAARRAGPHGILARALALQRAGEFEAALEAYGAVDRNDPRLSATLHYDLAQLYLRHALALGATAGGDVVGPLIELAKQEYREVLRGDSQAWDAKYDLELALSVQPDIGDAEAGAEAMPEHSSHAVATQRKFERLP